MVERSLPLLFYWGDGRDLDPEENSIGKESEVVRRNPMLSETEK